MKQEGKNRQPKGSLPKVGTARRAVRLLHGRGAQASRLCMSESEATSSTGLALNCSTRPGRPCPILKQQVWLQPMRFATPAWQAAVKSGTPAARHPYQFISSVAAAPLVRSVFPIVPKGRDGSPSRPNFCKKSLSQPFLWCLLMAGCLFCVSLTGCERQQPSGPPPPVAQTPSPTPKIELGEPPRMP